MKCVNNSFTNKDHSRGDNTIYKAEVEARKASGSLAIPSLFINKVLYEDHYFDPKKVYKQICRSFLDPQKECNQM